MGGDLTKAAPVETDPPGRTGGERWLLVRTGAGPRYLPAEPIREILEPLPLTRIPGAPEIVPGLANHRGTPVPVVDLGALLDGAPAVPGHHRLVLVEWRSRRIALAAADAVAFRAELPEDAADGTAVPDLDALLGEIF